MARYPVGALRTSLTVAAALAGLGLAALAETATATADPGPVLPEPVPVPAADAQALPPPPAAPAPESPYALSSETKNQLLTTIADTLSDPNMVFGLSAPPPSDPLAPVELLLPQNYRMPTPDLESPYLLTEGTPPGPFARVDAMKGVHALLHGALGRMPGDQLGDPLPGTAPPPGTNIPAGPEQFLPDPAGVIPPPG
ncbi:hypothetical protein ORI20_14740 [Mycobacterium sp. CVI_P3]|uniref:Uncharacterized protein n=1 Tax=Mycobacterium pinniadriaticum TaxID=2994102 RepID=A0ABT3SEX8_9MYCO|nr:hypothetical protein [Mycobacterium pinniadriaticum]MCX2931535.1 hypothetical protein [Mycobacterium pinniadriaticum]MCX2938073.1 hypothetical protein [Mycobacterium pinniadriaticum]